MSENKMVRMEKAETVERLMARGYRITKQRKRLIDVVFDNDCKSCKEVYYLANRKSPQIGIATVYRMMNLLEEVGAIKENSFIAEKLQQGCEVHGCIVKLKDNASMKFDCSEAYQIMEKGMEVLGYAENVFIERIYVLSN